MMSPNREYSRLSLARQIDTFWMEADHFERDVHILILSTLYAAKSRLDEELTEDSAKVSKLLDKATSDYAEHLSDQLAEINLYVADQERFLLNMAVVALASRLTLSLRQMSRSAETFSPREKRQYAGGDKSEFERLWVEFKERFGFEVRDEVEHVSFIEPLREVRNQIVHEGGLANPPSNLKMWDFQSETLWTVVLSISMTYSISGSQSSIRNSSAARGHLQRSPFPKNNSQR